MGCADGWGEGVEQVALPDAALAETDSADLGDCRAESVDEQGHRRHLAGPPLGDAEYCLLRSDGLDLCRLTMEGLPVGLKAVDDRDRVGRDVGLAHEQVAPATKAAAGQIEGESASFLRSVKEGLWNSEVAVSVGEILSHLFGEKIFCLVFSRFSLFQSPRQCSRAVRETQRAFRAALDITVFGDDPGDLCASPCCKSALLFYAERWAI